MTTNHDITLERKGNVALVTIHAEDTRNALDTKLAKKLREVCEQINTDKDFGAMVICGAGGNFCSGANRSLLASVVSDPTLDKNYNDLGSIYDAFVSVGHMEVPTVAAVSGAVVGAGFNLMLATDLRIVADDARIEAGFLRLGVLPGGGCTLLSTRAMGRQGAAALNIFGDRLNGPQAVAKGLAWESVHSDEVQDVALRYAEQAATDPTLAREAIRTFRDVSGLPASAWSTALSAERSSQMWSLRRRAHSNSSETQDVRNKE